jgi:hypothetical protein
MKNFLKQFEEVMASAAFAEAGEFDTARQMLSRDKTSNKKVLLATDTEVIHAGVIRHALNLCKRMGGRLEILHLLAKSAAGENAEIQREEMVGKLSEYATSYTQKAIKKSFENEVVSFTENRGDLLCVVLDTTQCRKTGNNNICRKYLAGLVAKITCPVVIYTGFLEA